MSYKSISATDFKSKVGQYIDEAAKEPIYITRYNRPVRVLVDVEEYERLKRHDTREALYPHELSSELKAELEKGNLGDRNPELDSLTDDSSVK